MNLVCAVTLAFVVTSCGDKTVVGPPTGTDTGSKASALDNNLVGAWFDSWRDFFLILNTDQTFNYVRAHWATEYVNPFPWSSTSTSGNAIRAVDRPPEIGPLRM
jgi:hypothetical protein